MHPFFLYEIRRQHMAEWERKAELRRMFVEDYGATRRTRKRRLRRVLGRLGRYQPAQAQTLRTDAYACR